MQAIWRSSSVFNRILLSTVGLGILVVAAPRLAAADDIHFVGYQYGPPGGSAGGWRNEASWFHEDQWFNFVVPRSSDTAIFDTGFDPQENGIPQIIHFENFTISAEPPYIPSSIRIPGGVATVDRLEIREGGFTFQFASDAARGSLDVAREIVIGTVADHPQGPASLTVRGGTLSQTADNGTGLLIGLGSNVHGRLVVEGPGAAVQVARDIRLGGYGGEGSLEVRDGGVLKARSIGSGGGRGDTGYLIVDGPGSTVEGFSALGSNGEVKILNGGHVSSLRDDGVKQYAFLSAADGANAAATVQGAGSRWDGVDWLYVGGVYHTDTSAHGKLAIRDGGAVEAEVAIVGDRFATGEVSIEGPGSRLQVQDGVIGISQGEGSLTIRDEGELKSDHELRIGQNGGKGRATIEADGRLTVAEILYVGIDDGSKGTLAVKNGGTVESGDVIIGADGSTGSATVEAGGRVATAKDLFVGRGKDGDGTLVVKDGGIVDSGHTVDIGGDGSTGSATVEANGRLTATDWISVGSDNGDGTLIVKDDGTVKSSIIFLGDFGGKGNATIQAGGRLEAAPYLGYGANGVGTLIVKDGGTVESDSNAFIGDGPGGKGNVIVETGGRLTVPNSLYVGYGGNGSLVVKDGGIVEASVRGNDGVGIGTQSGSEGSVTVQTGGRLTTNALNVGLGGDGTLVVEDGGIAESGHGRVARLAGSTGEATVQGDGSRWDVAQTMFVGGHADTGVGGTGLLTVRDEGVVSIGSSLTTWRDGTVDVSDNGRILIGEGRIGDVARSTILVGAGGTLAGDGTIIGDVILNGGILSPGHSPGLLTIDGDLRLGSNSVLDLEIGGLLGGSLYDQLVVTGDAVLDGQLHISFINGFIPSLGDAFDLITVAGLGTGAFSAIEFSGLGSSYPLTTGFEDGVFRLYVGDAPSAVPEPAGWVMLAIGLGGFAANAARRRQ